MSTKLTEQEIEEYKHAFALFDLDKSGSISSAELEKVLKSLGLTFNSYEVTKFIQKVDKDGEGSVNFEEFVEMVTSRMCEETRPQKAQPSILDKMPEDQVSEYREAFSLFDLDKSGSISSSELSVVLESLGLEFTETDLHQMISKVDHDGEGTMNFEEFVELVNEYIEGGNQDADGRPTDAQHDSLLLELSDEDLARYREAFNQFDLDNSGSISSTELAAVLDSLEVKFNEYELKLFINKVDKDGEGTVNFEEFVEMVVEQMKDIEERQQQCNRAKDTDKISVFSAQKMDEYREAFSQFDLDRSGSISCSELSTVMHAVGLEFTEEELQSYIDRADIDGEGTVNFEEFIIFMESWKKKSQEKDEMYEAFKLYDADGNGFICKEEFRGVMAVLGVELSDQEVEKIIHKADTDHDGLINYQEFVKMMTF